MAQEVHLREPQVEWKDDEPWRASEHSSQRQSADDRHLPKKVPWLYIFLVLAEAILLLVGYNWYISRSLSPSHVDDCM